MSFCEIATRGRSETRYTCLAVGDFHALSHISLALNITEEVPVVYFRIVFVLILKHDLRRFSGYLILLDCRPHFPQQRLEIEPSYSFTELRSLISSFATAIVTKIVLQR